MFSSKKIHPMLGTFCIPKKRKEAEVFLGTLLAIIVSFFILIFVAIILNLAESYWNLYKENKKPASAVKSEEIKGNEDFLGFKSILGIRAVHAATARAPTQKKPAAKIYQAERLLVSAPRLDLLPGEEAVYRITFKNSGRKTWKNSGANFVSIYTYEPKYRKSLFRTKDWLGLVQPAKLKQKQINPGEVGFFEFKLKAPKKLGAYTETFHLAAEDKAWIPGGNFTIPILVAAKKNQIGQAVLPTSAQLKSSSPLPSEIKSPIAAARKPYQTSLLLKSHNKVEARVGEVIDLRLAFKNEGTERWNLRGVIVPQEALEDDGRSIFYYPTWPSGHQPALIGVSPVQAGEVAFLDFKIKAPEAAGAYNTKFQLVVNYDQEVTGGEVELPVYVTEEMPSADESGRVMTRLNMIEPLLEIGLYYIENSGEAVELAADKSYQLKNKSGDLLASLGADESVRINYDFSGKIFKIQNARLALDVSGELVFSGAGENTIFTILSLERRTADGINDNRYRDGIILRQAETTGRLWVINRLPVEHYLWGIAETSNIAPIDYIKSVVVASRTYALYHYLNPYKYKGYFTLVWTTADQLYRGYNSELRRSRTIQAVNETRGQVVTYEGDIVVTPYFGHSDGRTRNWSEVWGGRDKLWLKPVVAPYDLGLAMFGHGVGMSQNDAYQRAKTDLWDYVKILKYYYNGIEVSRVY